MEGTVADYRQRGRSQPEFHETNGSTARNDLSRNGHDMKQMVPLPERFGAACINGLESTGLEAGVFMTMLQGL